MNDGNGPPRPPAPRVEGTPDETIAAQQHAERTITPGDWLEIEHGGRTVLGMIYRRQDKVYSFVYWDNLTLRFGTTTSEHIGKWHEELTALFRGQIAVTPDYVQKCITAWVTQPELAGKARRAAPPRPATRDNRPKVQKRLFPE